jgi:hypothetical protein
MEQAQEYTGMSCRKDHDNLVVNEDLKIFFKRTIRVPDNQQNSDLPPDLGKFPLKKVSDFADKLPESMASKGGLFFPMHCKYFAPLEDLEKLMLPTE